MIFTFTSLIASGQLNLELGIKAQKYEGTISTEGSSHIHLGYQWHEKWSAGVEYMYSSARFDIRLSDIWICNRCRFENTSKCEIVH